MQIIDFASIHEQLLSENALPDGYMGLIAEKACFNVGGVRALLNGNTRVYVSDDAKRRVAKAIIQILSEQSEKSRLLADNLQTILMQDHQPQN